MGTISLLAINRGRFQYNRGRFHPSQAVYSNRGGGRQHNSYYSGQRGHFSSNYRGRNNYHKYQSWQSSGSSSPSKLGAGPTQCQFCNEFNHIAFYCPRLRNSASLSDQSHSFDGLHVQASPPYQWHSDIGASQPTLQVI